METSKIKTNEIQLFKFGALVNAISDVHRNLAAQANKAVNLSLTMRNWIIGMYIAEYLLRGEDRADYGENLFAELSKSLKQYNVSGSGRRQLYNYMAFYKIYPNFLKLLPKFKGVSLIYMENEIDKKVRSLTAQLEPENLINQLSYTHFEALIEIEDSLKRYFYEIQCIKGNWSVRELKRQINSLYYERSGLSKNKRKLAELIDQTAEIQAPGFNIRDPYIFEFLGLEAKEIISESNLEQSILHKLQDFLLELGHGFCFEARQKRILIGGEYFFIDLVFYHRILKCHVLIELKVDGFSHDYLGQLNTYVNWYKKNETTKGDNPPIGLLLCTKRNHPLVQYALAGMDNKLFVSQYQLELPKKEDIERFLAEELKILSE